MPEKKLTEMHPADAAAALERLAEEEAVKKLRSLDPEDAADPLQAMEPWDSSRLIADLSAEFKAEILSEMHPDDSVDILQELSRGDRRKILTNMEEPDRTTISVLLKYPEDTAGGVMSPDVVSLPSNMKIQDAIEELRRHEGKLETLNYSYVVDESGKLCGVLALRDLAFRDPERKLSDIMTEEVQTVPPDMDREEVARAFDKYDYLALPVVDEERNLLGVVTVDDILDVLRQEDTEDMFSMVGVSEPQEESIWTDRKSVV